MDMFFPIYSLLFNNLILKFIVEVNEMEVKNKEELLQKLKEVKKLKTIFAFYSGTGG